MKNQDFKFNWPLIGNAHITEFLGKSITRGSLNSVYIFNGPDNLGKTTLANYFAQILLCENRFKSGETPCGTCSSCRSFLIETGENLELGNAHADFYLIKKEKDKKNISVEQVREFIRSLGMSSFSGVFKVGIIKHADSLSTEAANALLKTLEEPKDNVVIILITEDSDTIPQTIVSRSQILNFRLVDTDLVYNYLIDRHGVGRVDAKYFARLSLGRPAMALKFWEDKEFRMQYEDKVNLFLAFLNQDINARLGAIENLIDKKLQGQEAVRAVKRTLEVWQGVIRDFLLLIYNHNNLVQHHQVEAGGRQSFSIQDLLRFQTLCRQGEKYLAANVSPKSVLENIAINI